MFVVQSDLIYTRDFIVVMLVPLGGQGFLHLGEVTKLLVVAKKPTTDRDDVRNSTTVGK
jgi:hypothetical protein